MKMTETRMLIREKRLEKYIRILSNKYNLELKLSPAKNMIGACDTNKKVWISATLSDDPSKNLVLQKAVTLHELGHLLYTKSGAWISINHNLSNIVEDGRVEEAISRLFPKARLYLIYANQSIFDKQLTFPIDEQHITQVIASVMLRSAKKRTGIPQYNQSTLHEIINLIGVDNYNYFKQRTRDAVDCKTEDEASKITYEMQQRLYEITKQSLDENISNSSQKSLSATSSSARQMPKEKPDEISELLDSQNDDIIDNDSNQIETNEQQSDEQNSENIDNAEIPIPSDDTELIPSDEATTRISPDRPEPTNQLDELQSKIDNLLDQIEDTVTDEVQRELTNENDIIKSGEAEGSFPDYDIDEENDKEFQARTKYGSYVKHVDNIKLEPQARKVARQFRIIAEKGDGWKHNQKRGKLDMHQINRLFNNNNKQPAIFRKKDKIEGVDLAVSILLDASGSMNYSRYTATDVSYILSRALELGNYKSEVIQFGMKHSGGYTRHGYVKGYNSDCRGIKSFNQKTQYATKRYIPAAQGLTPLLSALEGAEKSLQRQSARRKVVLVVTDGEPYVGVNNQEYKEQCKQKVIEMKKHGYVVIGIGIETAQFILDMIFDYSIKCKSVSELETKMTNVMKNIIRHI